MQVPAPSTKNPLQTVSPIWAAFPPHLPQTDRRVQQVIQILTAQLQATHYVEVLADRVNLGPDRLARLFKRPNPVSQTSPSGTDEGVAVDDRVASQRNCGAGRLSG